MNVTISGHYEALVEQMTLSEHLLWGIHFFEISVDDCLTYQGEVENSQVVRLRLYDNGGYQMHKHRVALGPLSKEDALEAARAHFKANYFPEEQREDLAR